MSDYFIKESTLRDIAGAIREKREINEKIEVSNMAAMIDGITFKQVVTGTFEIKDNPAEIDILCEGCDFIPSHFFIHSLYDSSYYTGSESEGRTIPWNIYPNDDTKEYISEVQYNGTHTYVSSLNNQRVLRSKVIDPDVGDAYSHPIYKLTNGQLQVLIGHYTNIGGGTYSQSNPKYMLIPGKYQWVAINN